MLTCNTASLWGQLAGFWWSFVVFPLGKIRDTTRTILVESTVRAYWSEMSGLCGGESLRKLANMHSDKGGARISRELAFCHPINSSFFPHLAAHAAVRRSSIRKGTTSAFGALQAPATNPYFQVTATGSLVAFRCAAGRDGSSLPMATPERSQADAHALRKSPIRPPSSLKTSYRVQLWIQLVAIPQGESESLGFLRSITVRNKKPPACARGLLLVQQGSA